MFVFVLVGCGWYAWNIYTHTHTHVITCIHSAAPPFPHRWWQYWNGGGTYTHTHTHTHVIICIHSAAPPFPHRWWQYWNGGGTYTHTHTHTHVITCVHSAAPPSPHRWWQYWNGGGTGGWHTHTHTLRENHRKAYFQLFTYSSFTLPRLQSSSCRSLMPLLPFAKKKCTTNKKF